MSLLEVSPMAWKAAPRFDKHNQRWHVTLLGKRHILTPRGGTEAEAWKAFLKLTGDAQAGPEAQSVAELVEQWVNRHSEVSEWYRYLARCWVQFELETFLDELDGNSLQRYRDHLRKNNAPQTVVHKVNCAARIWRWGHQQKAVASLPQKPERAETIPVGHKDIPRTKLANIAVELAKPGRERLKTIVEFIFATGCRQQDARQLRWEWIDFDELIATIPHQDHKAGKKTGHDKVIFLNDDALAALATARERDGSFGAVFLTRLRRPYTKDGLNESFKRITGYTVHQIRHTACQSLLASGMPHEEIMALLGIKEYRTIQRYCQVRNEQAAKAAKLQVSPLRLAQAS